jgi:hypothetical protein
MLARMFEKRLKGYRSMGYSVGPVPESAGAGGEDHVVEYDEESLRTLAVDDF